MSSKVQILTFKLQSVLFALFVDDVQEVIYETDTIAIPGSPSFVKGLFSLRGEVITAIDIREVLGLKSDSSKIGNNNILITDDGELFSLQIDEIGEVIEANQNSITAPPSNMNPEWKDYSAGVIQIEGRLTIILDVAQILNQQKINI